SISQESIVIHLGPHQCGTCSGLVTASKTSLRGASKTRVMTISRSDGIVSVVGLVFGSAMLFLLCFWSSVLRLAALQLAQIFVQPVQALFPVMAIAPHPIGDLLERLRRDPARSPLGVAPPLD